MKNQALFSSKDKSKKLKCRLLQFLFGALRLSLFLLLQKKYKDKPTIPRMSTMQKMVSK